MTSFPIALLLVGIVLLLLGVLGRIESPYFKAGTDNVLARWVLGVLGAALITRALMLKEASSGQAGGVAGPSVQQPTPSVGAAPENRPAPAPDSSRQADDCSVKSPDARPRPDTLMRVIQDEQQKAVKRSYGELAGQNFSEDNLRSFTTDKVPARVVSELRSDNRFLDLVLAIKCMPPSQRQALLRRARATYKPTWADLGRVDPKGQTEAGQKAEKQIAEAIVGLVESLVALPADSIRSRYQ
jgi:hypothetical protein